MKSLKKNKLIVFILLTLLIAQFSKAQSIARSVIVNEQINNSTFLHLTENEIFLLQTEDPIIVDSRYFKKTNTTITITYNKENGLLTITDSAGILTNDLIDDLKVKVNSVAVAADSCGCGWWNIPCLAYCALCEAGIVCDEELD